MTSIKPNEKDGGFRKSNYNFLHCLVDGLGVSFLNVGMIAMQKFKHKTVKQEFRVPYFVCTGINAAACLGFGLVWMRSPALRAKVTHSLKGMGLPV
ncbi:hypothetical protein HK103_005810 [Boothiomyces macroporosus]|uniref:Uncharacterized protein n=1 Tax=Boothiomyces macroporosus TaxID=261099 RepID=A0AAD5UIU3_9FUNG|nr:hypothetical protein HK103_005810 [Boothiomyces macroporosus]